MKVALTLLLLVPSFLLLAAPDKSKVWTNSTADDIPADFALQGEYRGTDIGAQVIALGAGEFQVVVYPGGLPGDGWDGENRSLLVGKLAEDVVALSPAKGPRKYLDKTTHRFSASQKFPPIGHEKHTGTLSSKGLTLNGDTGDIGDTTLAKVVRKSETLGKKPPEGATILFDGSGKDHFSGGRIDDTTKLLNTDGRDIRTAKKYNNYHMHVEFMLPYRPAARGQGRGNSGFYQVDHYEVQILDSFGLEGLNNECGGVYKNAAPNVNMCFPPLTWQTYDAEFTNAVIHDGKKTPATLTLRHNGVVIHENLKIKGPTGGHRKEAEGTPGPVKFQGHGNPLQFRNIWIVEK